MAHDKNQVINLFHQKSSLECGCVLVYLYFLGERMPIIVDTMMPFHLENSGYDPNIPLFSNYRPPLDENIPEAYRKLIQSCWKQDPDDLPTFKRIIHQLRTNPKFITRDVDERLFRKYFQYIDEQEQEICNIWKLYMVKL